MFYYWYNFEEPSNFKASAFSFNQKKNLYKYSNCSKSSIIDQISIHYYIKNSIVFI